MADDSEVGPDGGTVHDAVDADAVDGHRLTLGRLTHERLLRRVSPALPVEIAERAVSWCLPWDDALRSGQSLAGVVVHAHVDEVDDAGRKALARDGAVAVVVSGDRGSAPSIDVTAEPPLLHAGPQVSFRELNHLIADLTLARETHVLRYGLTVHRSLVELLYRGSGLAALCHQMSRLSGGAVAILDPHLRVLAFEQSRTRVFEPGAVASALREVTDVAQDLEGHVRPTVHTIDVDGARVTCVLTPIVLGGRHDGWVAVVEAEEEPHPHDLAEHGVVVEQGATIVGTEMLRMRSVEQAEERARGDFVHALLHNRFATEHDLEARAAHYDFPVGGAYGVVVAGTPGGAGHAETLTAMFHFARDAARFAAQPGRHTLATVVGDVLAVVRQVDLRGRPGAGQPDAANRALAEYAAQLEQELTRRVRHPVAVAYGRPYPGAAHIFDSYREARIALGLRVRLGMTESCGFQDLRMYATLADLATSEQGRAFAADTFAPLRAAGTGGAGLEEAVVTYIRSGGNINAAARELHVHRNTMLYKLERASRLLRLDLRQAEHQFSVWLAHKLDLLAETSAAVDRDVRPT